MSDQRAKDRHRRKRNAVREQPEEEPEFQIAPMIDVLLVLLVFFMSISSTEVLQSAKGIDLPVGVEGTSAKKNKGQVVVNVTWLSSSNTGSITVDEKTYASPNDLAPMLRERVAVNPAIRVLVREDKQTPYEFTRGVMMAVGQAGIGNVTFSVLDKEAPGSRRASE